MKMRMLMLLLSGMLVLGVSIAFAEEIQPTDLEVLQAWGHVQPSVEPHLETVNSVGPNGLTRLTDMELDQIDAAAIEFGIRDSGPGYSLGIGVRVYAVSEIDEPGPMMPMKPKPMPTTATGIIWESP